jgi:DNA-binding transcriptional LysR family regulator
VDLEAMVIAVRTGDITATAGELGVANPAVIRRLRKLEQRVAINLFTGIPQTVGLTPAGKKMLPLITDAYEHLAALEAFVEKHADQDLADEARYRPR